MALNTGPIRTENRFPCQTLVAGRSVTPSVRGTPEIRCVRIATLFEYTTDLSHNARSSGADDKPFGFPSETRPTNDHKVSDHRRSQRGTGGFPGGLRASGDGTGGPSVRTSRATTAEPRGRVREHEGGQASGCASCQGPTSAVACNTRRSRVQRVQQDTPPPRLSLPAHPATRRGRDGLGAFALKCLTLGVFGGFAQRYPVCEFIYTFLHVFFISGRLQATMPDGV